MSRKFLTVLALIALFVAAMTGAAMAAAADGDIISVDGGSLGTSVEHKYVGRMACSDDVILLASGDLYYYNNPDKLTGRSFDIDLRVAFEGDPAKTSGWKYMGISVDVGSHDFYVVSEDKSPDKKPGVFRFQISFDKLPGMISIDNLAVSSDAKSADILLRMTSVDVLKPQTFTIDVDQTDATEINLISNDFGTVMGLQVRILSGDKDLMGYASDDTGFEFTSQSDGVDIKPKAGANLKEGETYHFALVGAEAPNSGLKYKELKSGDTQPRNVKVLGIENSGDMVVSFDVTVVKGGGGTLIKTEVLDVTPDALMSAGMFAVSKDYVAQHGPLGITTSEPGMPDGIHILSTKGSTLVSIDVSPANIPANMTAVVALETTIELSAIADSRVSEDFGFSGTDSKVWVDKTAAEKAGDLDSKGYALYYEFLENKLAGGTQTIAIIGGDSGKSWSAARSEGYVSFKGANLMVRYVVTNADFKGEAVTHGDLTYDADTRFIYIPDGAKNTKLYDPLWFTKNDPQHHSSSGCDAGFGAFALLALAGAAAILRRKG